MEGHTLVALGVATVLASGYPVVGSRELVAGLSLKSCFRQSAQRPAPYVEVHGLTGKAINLLGATDPRRGFGFGLQYAKPEPKFKYRGRPGELVQEGYYEHSSTTGEEGGSGANRTEAIGYLAMARYHWPQRQRFSVYLDLGLGLQYASQRTDDLPSRLNTTPVIDLGVVLPVGGRFFTVGARFLHISNARQVGNNPGQNHLFLDIGYRF